MPRSFSEEIQNQWKEKIQNQRQSGLSMASWCKKNDISITTFYYWRDKLLPKSVNRATFVELQDTQEAPEASGITIECQNFLIRLNKQFDPTTLQNCLKVL